MASNRHLGRIVALQTLYEVEFRTECEDDTLSVDEVLERNIERYSETIDDKQFIRQLVMGVSSQLTELDAIIVPIAPEWPIAQIARIDRNVLRMALWELNNSKDVPPKVVINEAVELAKAFGGDNSSKFINGVLGTAFRQIYPDADEPKKKSAKKDTKKDIKKSSKQPTKKSDAKKTPTKAAKKTAVKKKQTATKKKPASRSNKKPSSRSK